MHRELYQHLQGAKGDSHFVIAIFLDVRGFSNFAGIAESVEAAIFLRKMYVRILDDYFKDPDFFKPTGDGLMILYNYDEETVAGIAESVVGNALRLSADFPKLLSKD